MLTSSGVILLCLVTVLALGIGVLARRMTVNSQFSVSSNDRIRISHREKLGPHQQLLVVTVNERELLVGVSQSGIALIADITRGGSSIGKSEEARTLGSRE
jgi:flagellar biogenesis protein FliO